jgi:hypothetical protein
VKDAAPVSPPLAQPDLATQQHQGYQQYDGQAGQAAVASTQPLNVRRDSANMQQQQQHGQPMNAASVPYGASPYPAVAATSPSQDYGLSGQFAAMNVGGPNQQTGSAPGVGATA